MKKITLFLGLLIGSSVANAQGLENIIVEKYYVSNAADSIGSVGILPKGSVTYRIFVDMAPRYRFIAIEGNANHELRVATTTSFYNHTTKGQKTGDKISSSDLGNKTLALDSWFSVGGAPDDQIGVLKSDDDGAENLTQANSSLLQNATSGTYSIALTTQDGMKVGTPSAVAVVGFGTSQTELAHIFKTSQLGGLVSSFDGLIYSQDSPAGVHGYDSLGVNKLLIGQFTTNGVFSFELNVNIKDRFGKEEKYVAKNPVLVGTEMEILFPALTYTNTISVGINKKNNETNMNLDIYPNPTKGEFMVFANNINGNSSEASYSIYSAIGSLIAQNTLIITKGSPSQPINISNLPSGIYFVTVSIDGISSTKKLIKN